MAASNSPTLGESSTTSGTPPLLLPSSQHSTLAETPRFELFVKLPQELRALIWKAALPGPRVFRLWTKFDRSRLRSKTWRAIAPFPTINILLINRETFHFVRSMYTATSIQVFEGLGPDVPSPTRLSANFACDIFRLEWRPLSILLYQRNHLGLDALPSWTRHVRLLALNILRRAEYGFGFKKFADPDYVGHTAVRICIMQELFPALEQLDLMVSCMSDEFSGEPMLVDLPNECEDEIEKRGQELLLHCLADVIEDVTARASGGKLPSMKFRVLVRGDNMEDRESGMTEFRRRCHDGGKSLLPATELSLGRMPSWLYKYEREQAIRYPPSYLKLGCRETR